MPRNLYGFLFAIISCETKQSETNVIQKSDSVSQSEDSVSQTGVVVVVEKAADRRLAAGSGKRSLGAAPESALDE